MKNKHNCDKISGNYLNILTPIEYCGKSLNKEDPLIL